MCFIIKNISLFMVAISFGNKLPSSGRPQL